MYSKRDPEGGGRTKLISAVLVTFGPATVSRSVFQGRHNEWQAR